LLDSRSSLPTSAILDFIKLGNKKNDHKNKQEKNDSTEASFNL